MNLNLISLPICKLLRSMIINYEIICLKEKLMERNYLGILCDIMLAS